MWDKRCVCFFPFGTPLIGVLHGKKQWKKNEFIFHFWSFLVNFSYYTGKKSKKGFCLPPKPLFFNFIWHEKPFSCQMAQKSNSSFSRRENRITRKKKEKTPCASSNLRCLVVLSLPYIVLFNIPTYCPPVIIQWYEN